MLLRMWPRDAVERSELRAKFSEKELNQVYRSSDLVTGESCVFCATGISDSAMLPRVKLTRKKAITHSILMRAPAGRCATSAPCMSWKRRRSICVVSNVNRNSEP